MKWWRIILRNPTGLAGAVIVLAVAVLSLSAPLLPLADPAETNLATRLQSPGAAGHWLGTDLLGRDILSRLIWGTRLSLAVAAVATLFAAGVGSAIGLVAGYFGRRTDNVLMRGIDLLMAFPYLLLALAIVAVLGPGLFNALIAIAVVNIPFFARTVRGTAVSLVKRDFVDTARMSGRSELGILFGEVLPNVVPVIIITMATTLGWMILETAGLSFLGLGAQPPKADLGSMLGEGRKLLLIKPHLALLPGAVVFVLVMGINLLADALRDALDPRLSSGVVGRASGVTRVERAKVPVSNDQRSEFRVHAARSAATAEPPEGGTPNESSSSSKRDSESLIEVKDLTVKFQLTSDELVAAKDICFSLKRGETLGLVGESGSGKSVTALALMRLLPSPPACISGNSVRFDGREMLSSSAEELRRLRGNRVAYVFQDPLTSLNPMFTAGEQIAEVIRLHRDCTRREAWEEAVRLLDSLKIPDARKRAESYPHELSGGMRQRVGLAMALANRPDLLIADEPTTALDVTVQRVVIDLLREQIRDSGTALLFISHDLALVSEVCERVMVMKDGEIVEQGRTREVLSRPQQDYTRKLLDALPSAERAPELSDEEDVETLFELRQVGREFGGSGGGWFSGSRETVRALEDVSFAVPKGSTFGVVGESGCGKTTLARILCGLLPPSSGEVLFEGKQVSDWMNRVGEYRRRVQIVFQDPASSLNPRLRVRSILRQPLQRLADVHDADEQEAEMKKLLKQTGLKEDALDRFPHEFSGGQAQRIGIARALAARPAVLVLDEAVSSLDVSVQAQILDLLRGLRAEGGLTIVFVSHDLAVIRELCTHVAVLSGGRLVECGRAADIFDSPKEEYTQKLLASRVELAHGR